MLAVHFSNFYVDVCSDHENPVDVLVALAVCPSPSGI